MSLKFFQDIALANDGKINLYWKMKRQVNRLFSSPGYEYKRDEIIRQYYTKVDWEIAGRRVIEKSLAVISMPFTTTAIIADNLGIPSIYYDPTQNVNVTSSNNISVANNKNELNTWLNSIIGTKKC